MRLSLTLLFCFATGAFFAQDYTSYFTGDAADVATSPEKYSVLAGGGGDSDAAMIQFLQHADGGDVLVIRASGSDGYNDYLFSDLGVEVNSVETIVFHNAGASEDPYVLEQIANAEAIFIAGGDQSNYVDYWKDTEVETLLNNHIGPIGGTSAGMAILSQTYFSAANGTVYSDEALEDPFNTYMTLGHGDFLNGAYFPFQTVTDTHLDDPDRRARLLVFFAHMLDNWDAAASDWPMAVGCEEYTAVGSQALEWNEFSISVYGEYPDYEDYAYFIFPNCAFYEGGEPTEYLPEVFEPGQPITWNLGEQAVKVLRVAGTAAAQGTPVMFNDIPQTDEHYQWQDWYIEQGQFFVVENASPPNCELPLNTGAALDLPGFNVFPNPTRHSVHTSLPTGTAFQLVDAAGRVIMRGVTSTPNHTLQIQGVAPGMYVLQTDLGNQQVQVIY